MSFKVPPNNLEAEKSVLGGILLDSDSWDNVESLVRESDFYTPSHRKIFAAIKDLRKKNQPADLITISNQLSESGTLGTVGGTSYLTELLEQTPSTANIESYSKIIHEKSILRKLIQLNNELTQQAYSQDFENLNVFLDTCEAKIFALTDEQNTKDLVSSGDIVQGTIDNLEKLFANNGDLTGLSSGFFDIDKLTAGFQKGELTIIAARPSMGKTALSLNIALHAALREKKKVAYFSVEMGSNTLMSRLIANQARVGLSQIRTGQIKDKDWPNIITAAAVISDMPLFIDDSSPVSPFEIRSKSRKLKAKEGLDMIIVDYLQLMGMNQKTESREREVAEISKMLKSIAKELQVPVIALAQLNRGVEGRSDRRPVLSDLRESGSIEQDADVIMMLYREEYYDRDNAEVKGLAEIIIAKQRNGPTGVVKLRWQPEFGAFANNMESQQSPSPNMPPESQPYSKTPENKSPHVVKNFAPET